MRGIAHATLAVLGLAAALAAAPAPAEARGRELAAGLSATGSVFVTWHGDRARGCAAAGLCGARGSSSSQPVDGELYLTVGRHGRLTAYGSVSEESAPLVRVERREASGEVDTCVDASPPNQVDVIVRRGRHGAA